MKTFTPYAEGSGYTQLDNSLIDYVMPSVEPPAWVIICFIIRKTRGWHKESDDISLSQICDGTGLARPTAVKWVSFLESNGHILIGRGDKGTTNKLRLNPDFVIDPTAEKAKTKRGGARIKGLTSSNNEPVDSSNNELPPSSNFEHTKETDSLKEKGKKTPPPAQLPPAKQAKQPERPTHFDNLAAQWRGSDNSESVAELMLSLRQATNSMAYAQLQKAADTLDNIGITAEQVTTLYTGANCWWYRCDWRGKKGDKPNTTNILETALTGVEWLTNGGAAETERATEAALLYREWIAPLAAMNGSASAHFKQAPPKVRAAVREGGGLGSVEQIKRVSEADFAGWYAGVK